MSIIRQLTEAEADRAAAQKNMKTVEARRAALAGSETKVAQAKAVVAEAKAAARSSEDRLGKLELTYAAEMKSLKDSQSNASIAIKALSARADELNRRSTTSVKEVRDDSAKALSMAQQEIAAQKTAAAQAKKAAEKAVADARLDAEAKLAEANKATATARAQAAALKYSEFSSRYALLESKRRAKAISEEDFKAALAGLRKELGL